MENQPNSVEENKKENLIPEQLFTLVLRDLAEQEIRIKVTESRLSSVIHILSKSFFIEIR